jgi:hypothetical protein
MNVDKIFRAQLFIAMMAKVATVMAVVILALMLVTGVRASTAAVPIDSTASGVYLGSDRVCRIVLSRYQSLWITADVSCLGFGGAYTVSLTTLYAPGQCWSNTVAISLRPWAPNEYLALRSYVHQDQTLHIVRGFDPLQVANGLGTAEAWYRIGYAPSPSPYSCGSALNGRKG